MSTLSATLFVALVAPQTRVEEVECCASGGDCCRFHLHWRNKN
jgi:predicted hydrocarbon binding protein